MVNVKGIFNLFLNLLVSRGDWGVNRNLEIKNHLSGKQSLKKLPLERIVTNMSDAILGSGIVFLLLTIAAFAVYLTSNDLDFFALGILLSGAFPSAFIIWKGAEAGLSYGLDFEKKKVFSVEKGFFVGSETQVCNFSDIMTVEVDESVEQHTFGKRQFFFIAFVRPSLSKIIVSNLVEDPGQGLMEQAELLARLLNVPFKLSIRLRDKIANSESEAKNANRLW